MKLPSLTNLFKDNKAPKPKRDKRIKNHGNKPKNNEPDRVIKKDNQEGLTTSKAEQILKRDGKNELKQGKKVSATKIFAGQFKDFLVLILLVSAAVSVFMGDIAESVSISIIVLLNAVLGFAQEYKTEKTLEALKKMTAPCAKVLRDKKIKKIPASSVVKGDVILIEAGDRVPADAVLLSSVRLEADESILTGESVSAVKRQNDNLSTNNDLNKENIIYMGTIITKGYGRAKVVATGMNTQMGKISGMIEDIEEEKTPLQKKLGELGRYIIWGCLIISAVVVATGVLRGENLLDMLILGVSLAVAAVPEGLPAIVTIALALAVKRMVKRKALIRKLHAVETLGCATVICTDKTGTLTQNKMTVKEVVSQRHTYEVEGDGFNIAGGFLEDAKPVNPTTREDLQKILQTMTICNHAQITSDRPQNMRNRAKNRSNGKWKATGEPTETALLIAAAKGGITKGELSDEFEVVDEIPFDSERKLMSVLVMDRMGRKFAFVKGGYDVIAKRCGLCFDGDKTAMFENCKDRFDKANERLAKQGMRVLGMAYKEVTDSLSETNLTFLGICGIQDAPRKEAKPAVLTCRRAGIKTVMITGDHKLTACSIAKQTGIFKDGDGCLSGNELNNMSDEALRTAVKTTTVFARVSPEDKLRIVKAFKSGGHVVAMTGDGVNDAPAVKESNIGVSMGIMGSDVTKQAADVILLDDNFATLVAAVEEGRVIYGNIRRFIRYLLSCNIGEVTTMFIGMLIGMPVPLLPMQILMINLVTDGLPAIALGLEPAQEGVMNRPPRKQEDSIFSGGLEFTIIIRGLLIGFTALTVFTFVYMMSLSVAAARTAAFLALIVTQLIHVFECKSETKSLFSISYFNNKFLLFAVLTSMTLAVVSVFTYPMNLLLKTCPLTAAQTVLTLGASFTVPILNGIILKLKRLTKNKLKG